MLGLVFLIGPYIFVWMSIVYLFQLRSGWRHAMDDDVSAIWLNDTWKSYLFALWEERCWMSWEERCWMSWGTFTMKLHPNRSLA